jgi:RNA polymerase sigma factor (TIGR02999 family)
MQRLTRGQSFITLPTASYQINTGFSPYAYMNDVTRILNAIEQGDEKATDDLLPLVYEELRILAAQKLSREQPGQTLQATALVHEAYMRLIGDGSAGWDSRNHFFAAVAEAMRRIIIEGARSKKTRKRGGSLNKVAIEAVDLPIETRLDVNELIALDEALIDLEKTDVVVAELVKLHCFAGLPLGTIAEILGVSARTAERYWAFAKTWLYKEITGEEESPPPAL